MATPDEVMAAYPDCPLAVAFTEGIVCVRQDGESAWDVLMSAVPPMTPGEVAGMIREAAADELADHACKIPKVKMARVVAEMGHPSFLTFVAGKMGAV